MKIHASRYYKQGAQKGVKFQDFHHPILPMAPLLVRSPRSNQRLACKASGPSFDKVLNVASCVAKQMLHVQHKRETNLKIPNTFSLPAQCLCCLITIEMGVDSENSSSSSRNMSLLITRCWQEMALLVAVIKIVSTV